MFAHFIVSVISQDKPGIVEIISSVINKHKGNWLASNFSRLSGQFAGIVEFTCPSESIKALQQDFEKLGDKGVVVQLVKASEFQETQHKMVELSVVCNDRTGIINELSRCLAAQHINLLQLESSCEPAPNWGGQIFKATAKLEVPTELDIDELQESIEAIASDLIVELSLEKETVRQ